MRMQEQVREVQEGKVQMELETPAQEAVEEKQTGRPALGPASARQYDPLVIHASNLPDGTNEEGVRKVFEEFGAIADIRLMFTNAGVFKGFAYVQFLKEEDAAKVISRQAEADPEKAIKCGENVVNVQYALALRGGRKPTKL